MRPNGSSLATETWACQRGNTLDPPTRARRSDRMPGGRKAPRAAHRHAPGHEQRAEPRRQELRVQALERRGSCGPHDALDAAKPPQSSSTATSAPRPPCRKPSATNGPRMKAIGRPDELHDLDFVAPGVQAETDHGGDGDRRRQRHHQRQHEPGPPQRVEAGRRPGSQARS